MKVRREENNTIEVEDVTVEAAIRKALGVLKAQKGDVQVTVLNEEKKGLFGMQGAVMAKIKVSLKAKEQTEKQ
ncbi:MAG: Jag N-terminal domain-containing protein [Candidatus Omnitrophota bacterium]